MTEKVGDRIKKARVAAGLDQRQLAARMGINDTNISRWERDKPVPRRSTSDKIAQALGVNPDWLWYGTGDMFAPAEQAPPPLSPICPDLLAVCLQLVAEVAEHQRRRLPYDRHARLVADLYALALDKGYGAANLPKAEIIPFLRLAVG